MVEEGRSPLLQPHQATSSSNPIKQPHQATLIQTLHRRINHENFDGSDFP